MPRILFAHKNFPAQFGALGDWLAGQGWEVAFLTQREGASHPGHAGGDLRRPPQARRGDATATCRRSRRA